MYNHRGNPCSLFRIEIKVVSNYDNTPPKQYKFNKCNKSKPKTKSGISKPKQKNSCTFWAYKIIVANSPGLDCDVLKESPAPDEASSPTQSKPRIGGKKMWFDTGTGQLRKKLSG